MKDVKPVPVARKYNYRPFVFKDLATCSHVHLRNDARKALDRPYNGPYKVVSRLSDVNFLIDISGQHKVVSVERLVPAHFVNPEVVNAFVGPELSDGLHGLQPVVRNVPEEPPELVNRDAPEPVNLPPPRPSTSGNVVTSRASCTSRPSAERTYTRKRVTFDHTYCK